MRLATIVKDVRYAGRQLWRNPGFAITAVLAAICVLPLLTVAGIYLPARRAARVNPVSALRSE